MNTTSSLDFKFNFPVGYLKFHSDTALNFQFNRYYSTGYLPLELSQSLAQQIKTYDQVTPVMTAEAEKAREKGENIHAAFLYRFAEFFCFNDKREKSRLYQAFMDLFYQEFGQFLQKHEINYQSGKLKALKMIVPQETRSSNQKKARSFPIVLHGGGDSFIEEFFSTAFTIAQKGYDVIMFEGPGQGEPLHKYGLKMIPEWEKPLGAILDYFNLDDISLIGVSLGGYFACRAAAFDSRIKNVVLYDVIYDFYDCTLCRMGFFGKNLLKALVKTHAKSAINRIFDRAGKRNQMSKWLMEQAFFVNGINTPYEFLVKLRQYSTAKFSRQVSQNVLVMAGESDHYVPLRMFGRQVQALKGAKSVQGRIFKDSEQAGAHCQVGNLPLALDFIEQWLNSVG
jgi:pimeloyl-ACP methyl ester carboxylesterase